MEDLIEALQVFSKYSKDRSPTHCEHDVMYVLVDPALVSKEDTEILSGLSFESDCEAEDCFRSYRFGSS